MNRNLVERGSMTIETLILAPALMMLFLLVVYVGNLTEASFRVNRAADVAARVASQLQGASALRNGEIAGRTDLLLSRSACADGAVQVVRGRLGKLSTVSATVSCTVSNSGFALLSIPNRRLQATSTEVIDFYTGRP
jgi:Flp pilus assembly protein TadG